MKYNALFWRLAICQTILIAGSCSHNNKEDSQREQTNNANSEISRIETDTNDAAITLNRFKSFQPESAADSLYRKFIYGLIKTNSFNASLEHLKSYQSFFNKTPQQKVFAFMKTGEAYSALARYDSALKYLRQALSINLDINDSASAAECEHNIGYNLQFTADMAEGLKHIYNALTYYQLKGDSENIFLAYYDIAEVYYHQENFEKTYEYYKQCFEYYSYKSDTFQMAQMLTALSDVENKLDQTDDALEYGNHARALWKYLGDIEGEANCLNTLASIYVNQKKWKDAIAFYKESYLLVINTEFQRPIPVLTMNLGVAYMHLGNLDESEKYLLRAIDELQKAELYSQLQLAYKHTGELYKKRRMFDAALKYFERFDSLEEINAAKKSAEAIETLNVKYETSKKENEIMALNKEKREAEHRVRILYYVGIITFLVLALAIMLIILRNTKAHHRLQREKNERERELSNAKLRHEYDKKLMDDFAQRILDKNKLITGLEIKLKSAPGFNSSTESAKKSLEELSKLKILTAEDWDKFQMNYNKVFPGSIKKIITQYADLTEAELRMFLLIKLNIRIREVATVLGISQESVRKTRYRLRKKLNIGEEDDLDEFVQNFSASASEA